MVRRAQECARDTGRASERSQVAVDQRETVRPETVIAFISGLLVAAGLLAFYASALTAPAPLTAEVGTKVEGAFVALPDGMVHYRWDGPADGPVVVLLHGLALSSFVWEQTVDALAEAGLRVLSYDHFGRGWSDRPEKTYDVDLFDRQLLGLLDKLGVSDAVDLVGVSMGGAVAVVFADRHPKRVRRLVLIAPAGLPHELPLLGRLAQMPVVGDWMMTLFGRQVVLQFLEDSLSDRALASRVERSVVEPMTYKGYLPAVLSTLRNYPLAGLADTYARVGRQNRRVLLIWGEVDRLIPIANAQQVAEAMPGLEFLSVAGASHAVQLEQPEVVNPAIVRFLAK